MALLLNYWTLASFSIIIISATQWPFMPDWLWIIACIGALFVALSIKALRLFVGPCCACVVILAHGNLVRHQSIELFKAGSDITIIAEVDSFFKQISHGFQGRAVIRSINGERLNIFERPAVWLRSPLPFVIGDTIRARVRLKPVVGQFNQVGFDVEKFAYSRAIIASARLLPEQSFYFTSVATWRTQLFQRVGNQTQHLAHQGLLQAILFGVRHNIPAEVNLALQRSGLNHLVAISGLHVGIVYGVGWFLGRVLLSCDSRLRFAPMLAGVATASFYAYLAGFSVPTMRALMMCVLGNIMLLCQLKLTKPHIWLLMLSALLITWPQSATDPSLWLSMSAVAIIMLFLSFRLFSRSKLFKTIGLQVTIITLMLPISALVFGGVSVSALVYNLVFVPWFSVVVVPVSFLSIASSSLTWVSEPLWLCSDWSLELVTLAVGLTQDGWVPISQSQRVLMFVILIALLFSFWINKKAIFVMALVTWMIATDWHPKRRWQMNVLDVGHGLAVAVVQGDRVLLYDTGAAWQTSSYAERLITPWFWYRGLSGVDYFFISHFDNDHAGGWREIIKTWQPTFFIASQQIENATPCIAGQVWQWGRLEIEALWPPSVVSRAYNPHSCALKLTDKESQISVLLPGDIEKIAEWMLLRTPGTLDSDIVLAPHHGSRSSSMQEFVEAVSPHLAIGSSAYQGRWGLPDNEVVQRYRNQGALWLDTGSSGQILVDFYSEHYQVTELRPLKGQAWYRQMLRKGVE